MSAYINLGMISPYRMARDAASTDKFLSEFVGFRESAYLWCLLHPGGYADVNVAVPAWARGQLRAAASAGADAGPDLAALECGQSGDALWDDCQRSLVLSGELHNNVRMAWGKAIPQWHAAALRAAANASAAPPAGASAAARLQGALDLLIRLNDRFALDGGAPPSYGGLLWCLGWRDRPGSNGCPTQRPTSVMARRIKPGDLEQRAQWRCGGQLTMALASRHYSAAAGPSVPTVQETPPAAGFERGDALPPAKRAKAAVSRPSGPPANKAAGTLWSFLNRESAAALPVRGSPGQSKTQSDHA